MQKWSLKCCWGCWKNNPHLHCQYCIYQDNSCTKAASSSSGLWGRAPQQDWESLALEDCILLCVSAGCCQLSAWKSEYWKLSEVSEAQSPMAPHNDFLVCVTTRCYQASGSGVEETKTVHLNHSIPFWVLCRSHYTTNVAFKVFLPLQFIF